MSGSDYKSNSEKYTSRSIKLGELKSHLTNDTYNTLKNLLDSLAFDEFDMLFDAYSRNFSKKEYKYAPFMSDHTSLQNSEADKYLLKIEELEHKLREFQKNHNAHSEQMEKLKMELSNEIESKEKLVSQLKVQHIKNKELQFKNQELSSKIQQKKIDEKVPEYVQGVKAKLQQDDKDFTTMSYNWAIAGILFSLLSISAAFLTFFYKIDIKDTTPIELFYYFTRGLLGVALLSWLSYFCLNNSKKYTHEAIIRKDRQHALMFGEVFLQIYGSTATKQDAIDVFKDWNMSANSAFADKTQPPPNLFNILGSLVDKKSAANDDIITKK
ncbi:hypothetical protein [Escherichia sp. E4385]|uniref:hypothetical protein n=1 Tax=Escherichia sp. E4385 TaxID=2040639 RepID=UPI001F10F56B|nr:hypothetical protein [Escherichia sp. E4385]